MTPWPRGSRGPRAGRARCVRRCKAAASLLGAVAHGLAVLVGVRGRGPMTPLASILDQAGSELGGFLPRLGGALVLLVGGFLAAWLLSRLVAKAAGPGGPGCARRPRGHGPGAGQGRPGALADPAAGRRGARGHHRGGHLRRAVAAGAAVPERVAQPGGAVPAQAGGGRRAAAGRRRGRARWWASAWTGSAARWTWPCRSAASRRSPCSRCSPSPPPRRWPCPPRC